MQHTRIEWVKNPDGSPGYSWNPIKGICPQECWYCYARRIYKRFYFNPSISTSMHNKGLWENEIMKLERIKKPSTIFVGSTIDLFHNRVMRTEGTDGLQKRIFDNISPIIRVAKYFKQHTFLFLTKNSKRYWKFKFPENCWLGLTLDGWNSNYGLHNIDIEKIKLLLSKNNNTFLSLEPLLSSLKHIIYQYDFGKNIMKINWIIIGRLTGYGNKYNPKREWIEEIIEIADNNIPIFLKNNLIPILGKDFVMKYQEMPNAQTMERNDG